MSLQSSVINIDEWLAANEADFSPPVCNKLLHNEQLSVMFVGGPNERRDYHIESGEELFLQLRGHMCLKLVEHGGTRHRDVHIAPGEMFLLPAHIPHSPQRTASSIGLVIERRRAPHRGDRLDTVRWYVPDEGSTRVLYERTFACVDLGKDLVPVIRDFKASDECRTGVPSGCGMAESPVKLSARELSRDEHGPFVLDERLERGCLTPAHMRMQFHVSVLRRRQGGKNADEPLRVTRPAQLDAWLWQLSGSSRLATGAGATNGGEVLAVLGKHDSLLLRGYVGDSGQAELAIFTVQMDDDEAALLCVWQKEGEEEEEEEKE